MFLYSFEASTLSSLFSKLNSESNNACFSVEVDVFSPNRLENIKKIGFMAKLDALCKFDFDVMDTLIQYRQIQAEVFLQIPHDFFVASETAAMTPHDILVLVNSIDVNLILMPPPSNAGREEWSKWHKLTVDFAEAMLNFHPFSKELLPVSSYVQYMAMRVVGYQPKTLTDDPMMKHFFEDGMNVEAMDALKVDLEDKIISAHGGKEAFESYVYGTLSGLYERLDERSHDFAETFVEWIEQSPEEHLGYVMTCLLKALDITDKPFVDLMIDMAGDARRANISIMSTLTNQLSPEGRAEIPSLFLEDSELSPELLDKYATKVHDFLTNIVES